MAHDVRLIRSPISVVGMVLTTVSAVLFLIVFLADLFGLHSNPYVGVLFFLVFPAIFLVGLLLIPIGAWYERRRRAAGKAPSELSWPRVDLNVPRQRRTAVAIFALTMANVVVVSLAAYKGIEYMDSVSFCGQVCHEPMRPEFTAHQDAPHSGVACVRCHVGPGAASLVSAKVAGVRRVVAVALNSYSRPIPAPVHDLRPAREICQQCHWPAKTHGDLIRRVTEYADDEENTELVTTLQVHVGGGSDRAGGASGIHWHASAGVDIEYVTTDEKRQVIPYVRLRTPDGTVREYVAEGVTPEEIAKGERRKMDCLDCHNRPSHTMTATAERAVDRAIAAGEIPKTLPFVRREVVKAVKGGYASQDAGAESVARALRDFYSTQHSAVFASQREDVERAVSAAERVYRRNVFPEMKVEFGSYPNHIGHTDTPGCFRCHDDSHKAADGKVIAQECDACHTFE